MSDYEKEFTRAFKDVTNHDLPYKDLSTTPAPTCSEVGYGCLIVLALSFLLDVLAAKLFEWAWNVSIATLFHLPTMTYIQALAIIFLLSILGSCLKITVNSRRDK